jgi:hypothetical protein
MYPPAIQFESRRREIELDLNRRIRERAARETAARRYRAHDHSELRILTRRARPRFA